MVSVFVSSDVNECRTFASRGGRITVGQRRALKELLPRYGLTFGVCEWDFVFGRRAPLALEIGGGYGEAAIHFARVVPEFNYLVAEVYPPALGAICNKIAAAELQNVRVICADARAILREMIADGGAEIARIYFPDPWPKKRHHKRRLINAAFVALLAQKNCPRRFRAYRNRQRELCNANPRLFCRRLAVCGGIGGRIAVSPANEIRRPRKRKSCRFCLFAARVNKLNRGDGNCEFIFQTIKITARVNKLNRGGEIANLFFK